jgi:hypothetical protein
MLLRRGCVEDDSGRYLVKIRIDSQGSESFSHILIPLFEAYKFSAFSAPGFLHKSGLYV